MPAVLRTYLEMVRHAVAHRVRARERSLRREVATALSPAELPRPTSRDRSEVWGITIVRNEVDVIDVALRHQVAQGLDAILVADNLSTDGTSEILRELQRELPIHVIRDDMDAFYQAAKSTRLSELARRAGAGWIVPFDADEFWFAPGMSVGAFLRQTDLDVVKADVHNLFPLHDARSAGHPIDTIEVWRFDRTPVGRHKVAFRSHPLATLTPGAHNVRRGGRRGPGLFVAHLPWRSEEQFSRKLRQGKKSVEATDLGREVARHYRALGSADDDEMRSMWQSVIDGRPVSDLYWAPVGPFVEVAALEWESWPESLSR